MLIYDGDCGFCTRSAQWVIRRAPAEIRVEPWQALSLERYGLTEHEVTTAAIWIDDPPGDNPGEMALGPGPALHGHLAIARSLEAVGRPYRWLGWLLARRPVGLVAAPVYRLLARNRHRLPGSTDACRLD